MLASGETGVRRLASAIVERAAVHQSAPCWGTYAQSGQISVPRERSIGTSQCGQRCVIQFDGHIDDTNRFPRRLSKSAAAARLSCETVPWAARARYAMDCNGGGTVESVGPPLTHRRVMALARKRERGRRSMLRRVPVPPPAAQTTRTSLSRVPIASTSMLTLSPASSVKSSSGTMAVPVRRTASSGTALCLV